LSLANFTLWGKRPSPQHAAGIAELFGMMTHTFTPTRLLAEYTTSNGTWRMDVEYFLDAFTSTTVTLVFPQSRHPPEMTMYRGDGHYFVRSGENLEYFTKLS
jgi:hypothetical protein